MKKRCDCTHDTCKSDGTIKIIVYFERENQLRSYCSELCADEDIRSYTDGKSNFKEEIFRGNVFMQMEWHYT